MNDEISKLSYKLGGRISKEAMLDKNVNLELPVYISPGVEIATNCFIGKYTFINKNVIIYKNVEIGKYCSLGRNCEIGLSSHPTNFLSTHLFQVKDNELFIRSEGNNKLLKQDWIKHRKVSIGSDVWIGAKVSIMNGISIGHGTIVGANSLVTKDVEPYSIIAGSPAKFIRKRFSDKIINELLLLKWWELDIKDLGDINFSNINECIDKLSLFRSR